LYRWLFALGKCIHEVWLGSSDFGSVGRCWTSKTGVKSLRLSSGTFSLGGSSADEGNDSDVSNIDLEGVKGAAPDDVSPEAFRVCGVSGLRPTITVLSDVRDPPNHLIGTRT